MKGRHRLVARSLLVIGLVLAAASPALAGTDQVTLILNAPDKAGTPRNYRAIKELAASGSGQFSAKQFDAVRERAGGRPLVVLDFRQESHGFVGGNAVSWFGTRDAANSGNSPEQISRDESALLAGIAGQPTVTVQKVTNQNDDRDIKASKPIDLPAQTVQSEDDVVRAGGAGYVRVHAADSWVHVHCAAGQGRTTHALVMFDALENATTTSLQDIVDRRKDAGGTNMLSTKSTPAWRHDGEVARANLVRRFYQYAKEHPRGEGETWSSWSARNP